MKNLNLPHLFKAAIYASFLLLVSSCLEESVEPSKLSPDQSDKVELGADSGSGISVEDGILHFSTPELFDKTMSGFANMSTEDLVTWAESYDFNSMLKNYTCLLRDQQVLYQEMAEIEGQSKDLGLQEEEKFLRDRSAEIQDLKLRFESILEQGRKYEMYNNLVVGMKIHNQFAAPLVNENGFVVVGNHLLQYTEDQIKLMPYGGLKSIELLAKAQSENEELGIRLSSISTEISSASRTNSGSTEKVVKQENCEFYYDPDYSGDNFGQAALRTTVTQKAKYKTVNRTTCVCIEFMPAPEGDRQSDQTCIKWDCKTTPVTVFSHWERDKLQVSGGLVTYSSSCKFWNFLGLGGCLTTPSAAEVSIEVSEPFYFRFSNNSRKISLASSSSIGFTREYDYSQGSTIAPIPEVLGFHYGASDWYSGGIGGCSLYIDVRD